MREASADVVPDNGDNGPEFALVFTFRQFQSLVYNKLDANAQNFTKNLYELLEQCMQGKAEHEGECDRTGSNCKPGCVFTVKTNEPTNGGQVLKPFEDEIFVLEGFHNQMEIRLKSRRGPGTRRGIELNRLYSGPDSLYSSPVLLAKINVEATCP